MKKIVFIALCALVLSCKREKKESTPITTSLPTITKITHATGFSIEKAAEGFTVIAVSSPWPGSEKTFKYALVDKEKMASLTLNSEAYDAIVAVPIERLVVTSTTHIPSLEALGVADRLVGFPNTDLISSEYTRKRILDASVKELGNNESINTEITISLNPEVVIGFGMNNRNKAYETIAHSNIPVVLNGDWTEESPLGKAEWIKFFAPFFQLETKADSIFSAIESSYQKTKALVAQVETKPTVLTGGLYKDVWHVAGGKSWMAQFLEDAKADYLYKDDTGTGGISLSLEAVLAKSQQADYWLNPSMITSYSEMEKANAHYTQFKAFKNKTIFSNTLAKGSTGGLLYYEMAPMKPDLVLKDLIHIFHPELLPDYEPFFFKPLE
ncbi:iron complex transport system substrate-binding protein [Zobellia uliginosa]|uniref:Iron complex transport system substrate-binding protein n=1 Tax=Zobellia uliginosa TaxID=143224 RepID=A0ABY1KQA5_9FLAO|nr:ABC transporter substrate-binding protein [Zobellia uliginosa]SIS64686.1 iron complex transport system substrate-binding protein [Zobellia uliginosa]